MNKKLFAMVALVLVVSFVILIYPTLFFYTKWNISGNRENFLKINRVTGKVQMLNTLHGWEEIGK